MRILMLSFDDRLLESDSHGPGDAQQRHIKYTQALRRRFPNGLVDILARTGHACSAKPVSPSEGLTVYPIASRRGLFAARAQKAAEQLARAHRYELVTTQTPFDDGFLGLRLKKRFGIPLNVQMRSSFLDQGNWVHQRRIVYPLFNVLGKRVVRQADTVRILSYGEQRRLERRFPSLAAKLFVLQPLVNLDVFDSPPAEEQLAAVNGRLKQHGLEDCPYFLFPGRLAREKNLLTVLRAMARLRQRGTSAALVLAGDGPLRPALEETIRKQELSGKVLMLGTLTMRDLKAWFALARAVVIPSFQEGFCRAVVESYLMGTPAIVTPFVSAPELVRHGRTGLITRGFTDPEELADGMAVLSEAPERAHRMGQEGKAHMSNYVLGEDEYMRRLLELWKSTAERRGTR